MISESNHKILVIDDDPLQLLLIENILSGNDFQIISQNSGQQGLNLLKENGPVSVIFSDFQMPEMNGLEFFKTAKIISPNSYRVLVSAEHYIDNLATHTAEETIHCFLKKPLIFGDVVKQAKVGCNPPLK